MSHELVVTIPPGHPSLAGHFPGNPIVPGAVIMAEISAAASERFPDLRVKGVRRAKFLAPVKPGQQLQIHLQQRSGGDIDFECTLDTGPCITGSLIIEVR
jgi:3-hydroxyacyl-[acyl-carrier-protein] dehydratase